MIIKNEIHGIGTLNTLFQSLFHAWQTGYSSGEEQGWQETEKLLMQFGILQNGKNYKTTVLLLLTSYFYLEPFFSQLDSFF